MSLRSLKNKKFNRQESRETTEYWLTLFEDNRWYEDEWEWDDLHRDYYYWYDYSITNIDDYHRYKLLTLLHSLHVDGAMDTIRHQGW